MKGTQGGSFACPPPSCEDKERRILNRPSPGSKSAGVLVLDFSASKTEEFLLFISYPSMVSITQTPGIKALMEQHQLASLISSNSLIAYSYWGGSALRSAFKTSQKAW